MGSTPVDTKLYRKIVHLADKKFDVKTSAYRSAWIVREYKKRGGKYVERQEKSTGGLLRWFKEKWVNLRKPSAPCGRDHQGAKGYPLCRPSVRVNRNTPKIVGELSKRSIAKAMRKKARYGKGVRVRFDGGGGAQYFGKTVSRHGMVNVPKAVARCATKAFKLRALGFGGGKSTGWKRAKQLATRATIPLEDVRYMRNWFARHVHMSHPGYKKWVKAGKPVTREWHSDHGIVSWLIWGGDAGYKWINTSRMMGKLNVHFRKRYALLPRI